MQFSIYAEDCNIEDSLTARLFKQASGTANDLGISTQLEWIGIEVPLDFPTLPDKQNPTRRFGVSPSLACPVWGAPSGTTDVYVIVADRSFSMTQPDQVIPGGLSDSNHWELGCQ